MRQITIRQFHSKMWDEIKDLPCVVTRNNIPIFRVESMTVGELSELGEKILEKIPEKCVICGGVADAIGKVYNEGEWEDAPMCRRHVVQSLREFGKE